MDSMNNMCKNVSALLGLHRTQESSAIDERGRLTTSTPTETGEESLDVFSGVSTDIESPHHAKRSANFATASTYDSFSSLTTSGHADTDLYIADNGANVVENSFNVTFADQLTTSTTQFTGEELNMLLYYCFFVQIS